VTARLLLRCMKSAAMALAVIGLTTACVAGTSTSAQAPAEDESGPVELEFWTINLKKNFNDYVQGLIDNYTKEHPNVTIKWVDVPGNDVTTKLASAMASGDVPDVVNLTNIDLERFIPSLADLNQYVTPEQQQAYVPSLIDPLRRDGKLVGIPWYNGGSPISVINSELVAKAGLDPANPPKTLDEALEWGAKVHAADPNVYGMNGIPNEIILSMEGVPLLTPDRKRAAFNTPEAVAVLEKWRQAMEKGALAPGSTVKDERQYPQTLQNQQVAFSALSYPFNLTNLQKNAPDVFGKLRVGPGATGKSGKYPLTDQQTFVVPSKSRYPRTAADFILYITNAANQTAFCKLVAIYPSSVEALKDPFFTEPKQDSLIDQARALIAQQLPKTELSVLGTGKDQQLRERLQENVRAFMTGTKSAQQALADAEREWNDLLAS